MSMIQKKCCVVKDSRDDYGFMKNTLKINHKDHIIKLPSSCYINRSTCNEIFGDNQSNHILKIDFKNKSIYREVQFFNRDDYDYVALDRFSLGKLGINLKEGKLGDEVMLSKGSKFSFYWNHPIKEIMLAMRFGVIGVILALASVLISIIN